MIDVIAKSLSGSLERAPWGWALLFTAFITLVKVWPIINKQVADAKEKLRAEKLGEKKEQRDDLRDRIATLEKLVSDQGAKIESLTAEAQSYQMKLVSALAAFRLLAGEIEKNDPTNAVLKQATDLIGMAATGDMGMGRVMEELARIPSAYREAHQ